MQTMLQDLRYGVRMLLKKPGFTLIAIITLSLGIGANTAIFSVVNGVLLRPLPYKEPERLVVIRETKLPQFPEFAVASGNFLDWVKQNTVFERLIAMRPATLNLADPGNPELLRGLSVTSGFCEMLGIQPQLGRDFLSEEAQPGRNNVVLLSHALWQRRFGGDPKILNRTLPLDGQSYTVIGVMPEDFHLIHRESEIWTLIAFTAQETQNRGGHSLSRVIGQLKPGVSVDQARTEMSTIAARLAAQYPINTGWNIKLMPLLEFTVRSIKPALLLLLAAVAFVLLIACVNVANLMLARAAGRSAETAIRAALGASRWRLIRQLLTECILLSLLGGAVGILLAYAGIDWVKTLNIASLPRLDEISINLKVLAFTLAASAVTGLIFGLLPSLQFSVIELNESLKEGRKGAGGGGHHRRWLRGLVVVEIALALVLLVGAGLLLRSFQRVTEADPGFNPRNVLTLNVPLPQANYPDQQRQLQFYETALPKLDALPGVESASGVFRVPLIGLATSTFSIEGKPVPVGNKPNNDYRTVSPNYFRTMGIALRQGRGFTERDKADAPDAVIINEELARRFFPGESPIGKRVQIGAENSRFREIVGVVENVHLTSLDGPVDPAIYIPMAQNTWPQALRISTFAIRTSVEPRTLLAAIRNQLHSIDSSLPVTQVQTMEEIVSGSLAQRRFNLTLLMIFAAVAGVLAIVGIYGVMSYNVTQQTPELGIRMALGAQQSEILKMVVGDGAKLAMAGVAIGLAGSLALTRLMAGLLFGVSATDPLTFVAIALALTAVCILAALIPARKAAKVNPIIALRGE